MIPTRVNSITAMLPLIAAACAVGTREAEPPAPVVNARAADVNEAQPIMSIVETGAVDVTRGAAHLYPELTPHGPWGRANTVELSVGRSARMIRNCTGDTLIVALAFADELSTDALVVVKLGAAWDAPETTTEWDTARYLATVKDSAATDFLDQVTQAGVDTLTTWVADTVARVYPMAVAVRDMLAACPR